MIKCRCSGENIPGSDKKVKPPALQRLWLMRMCSEILGDLEDGSGYGRAPGVVDNRVNRRASRPKKGLFPDAGAVNRISNPADPAPRSVSPSVWKGPTLLAGLSKEKAFPKGCPLMRMMTVPISGPWGKRPSTLQKPALGTGIVHASFASGFRPSQSRKAPADGFP